MIQRLGVEIPAEVEEVFNLKNYWWKLPIANKFQLGNISIVEDTYKNSEYSTIQYQAGRLEENWRIWFMLKMTQQIISKPKTTAAEI